MADQWHFTRSGQRQGPVTLEQLREAVGRGEVAGNDLVWCEGMANWAAVASIGEVWSAAPAGASVAAVPSMPMPLGAVGYEAPSAEPVQCTAATMDLFRQTRRWVRIVGVFMWLGCGLFLLIGVGGLVALVAMPGKASEVAPLGAYLVLCPLYAIPAVFLWRYGSRINDLLRLRRADLLEQAVSAQKSFWKYVAIMMLVVVGLYALAIVTVVAFFAIRAVMH